MSTIIWKDFKDKNIIDDIKHNNLRNNTDKWFLNARILKHVLKARYVDQYPKEFFNIPLNNTQIILLAKTTRN